MGGWFCAWGDFYARGIWGLLSLWGVFVGNRGDFGGAV